MCRPSASSPRHEIAATPPAHHGALDYAELEQLGLDPDTILDFSVNSNPYGPAPLVRQAIAGVPLDRYPDRESLALRRALADHLDVSPARIVVGNGTAELLWLLAFSFLLPGARVLIIGPTFGEYSRLASLMGANVQTWNAQPANDFAVQFEDVDRQLHHLKPQLAFLCNPNNPTGAVVPPEVIAAWAAAHPRTLFVVDEAYLAFAAVTSSALAIGAANILVLRSMTKDYALAGLRLGYAVGCDQAVIDALARVRPAWNVSALAQAAGITALADQAHLRQSITALARTKKTLMAGLRLAGLPPVPSTTHFFLVQVGNGTAFRRALLERGILVRDCTSFDLPAYVRIATRRPEENSRLLAAICAGVTGAAADG